MNSNQYPTSEKKWQAHDRSAPHPIEPCNTNDHENENVAEQVAEIDQTSNEVIVIRDSCDITVETTDTQVAVSLQVALQVAIAIVINITIADNSRAEAVTADLLETADVRQANRQKLIIVNSRSIDVATTDTDVAISLQLLLQILVALVVQLDIL
ncbi:spore coat protein [Virgibacillus alimentarius]|uniref:spore coat protein n=1 Tax=Virgibacillus alimentarius TaxID=698769 RepID=UPI0004930141|nr:spore coat protein [Virgibacillus alimentarius]